MAAIARELWRKAGPGIKAGLTLLAAILLGGLTLAVVDWLAPVDLEPRTRTQVVVDDRGEPLRRFADEVGVWRYPTDVSRVSPNYLDALLTFEDRWFYRHPGVNPLSLLRALGQWVWYGERVSGGSTLTMQVARIRYPGGRGWGGKLAQLVRALQLDWHYSKTEILDYYLNHAPFGGAIEGVEAASRSYFGHSADYLTDAQAALLAGLPQAPSYYRPDRHPERARRQRDKVLARQERYGVLTSLAREQAMQESVQAQAPDPALLAPLLARRLSWAYPEARRIDTFIDRDVQQAFEQLARDAKSRLPAGASIALMAMEHGSGRVIAYVGSADFLDAGRFGHIDMVQARRSPGSTLKPFIYGLALDAGLIHSESLLMDVPLVFGDYRPTNFQQGFNGPVSVSEALQRSLNLPAVQVLEQLDARGFYGRLQSAGAGLELPAGAGPSLALALGGVSGRLENLVRLYSALGNEGRTLAPRFTPEDPVRQAPLLSAASSWIVRDLLEDSERRYYGQSPLSIKTGTSSGNRDAWALAVSDYHTLGVWVGQPDNAAMAGHYGRVTAVPLVRAMADRLPRAQQRAHPRPDNVSPQVICWPGGRPATDLCDQQRTAWVIDGRTPVTLMSTPERRLQQPLPQLSIRVAADTGLRVSLGCVEDSRERLIPVWPASLQNWIPADWRTHHRLPARDPRCALGDNLLVPTPVRIEGLADGSHLKPHASTRAEPTIKVRAVGGQPDWYWFLDGELLDERSSQLELPLPKAGEHQLTVTDQSGESDQIRFVVEL